MSVWLTENGKTSRFYNLKLGRSMDVLRIICGGRDVNVDQLNEKQSIFTFVNVKIFTFHDLMFKN